MAAPTSTLGPRGKRLWTALHRGVTRDAATDALALEACRIADRLDRLDALLRGDEDEWLRISLRPSNRAVPAPSELALIVARQNGKGSILEAGEAVLPPQPAALVHEQRRHGRQRDAQHRP